ncbi:hypothetical protein HMPREF9072_01051 [Capnocytophaga sp. oral taxon 324 str. F0483]|nr:hypothetical protein HMPREF9072_01051 [Capnocytophaga sp. oral taxon 324 str. F0483]
MQALSFIISPPFLRLLFILSSSFVRLLFICLCGSHRLFSNCLSCYDCLCGSHLPVWLTPACVTHTVINLVLLAFLALWYKKRLPDIL